MIIIRSMRSPGGNEVEIANDCGEKYRITLADAKRLGVDDQDNLPVSVDDDEYVAFLDSKLKAVRYCKYLLGFSDKSAKTLLAKMREKEYSDEVCNEALRVLKDSGFLNETDICLSKVKSIAASKPYGPYRIRAYLSQKGFGGSDIEKALEDCGIDFDGKCLDVLFKMSPDDGEMNDPQELLKLKAKLSRYGFSSESIRYAVKEYNKYNEE